MTTALLVIVASVGGAGLCLVIAGVRRSPMDRIARPGRSQALTRRRLRYGALATAAGLVAFMVTRWPVAIALGALARSRSSRPRRRTCGPRHRKTGGDRLVDRDAPGHPRRGGRSHSGFDRDGTDLSPGDPRGGEHSREPALQRLGPHGRIAELRRRARRSRGRRRSRHASDGCNRAGPSTRRPPRRRSQSRPGKRSPCGRPWKPPGRRQEVPCGR